MYNLFDAQEKKILEILTKNNTDSNKNIFFIGGQFGVGKTEFINSLAEKNLSTYYSDIIIKFNYNQQYYFFPDFLKNASISVIDDNSASKIAFEELNFFYDSYYQTSTNIQSLNEDIYNNYIKINKLKSISECFESDKDEEKTTYDIEEFIKTNIEKKGYRRILLNYFEVATESLIMDLLSLFFLSSENNELKNIQIGGDKKTITLIFDNYDRVAGTINKWIFEFLYDYFLNKKFSDFISYSINFENSNLRVGELFDLNLIISGRFVKSEFIESLKPIISKNSEFIELNNFDEISLKKFFEDEFKDLRDKTDQVFVLSKGIPAIVFFITRHFSKYKKIPNKNEILDFAIQQIFLFTPDYCKKCVILASFAEKFEKTYFRCFDDTKDSFDFCYSFVQNSLDLFNHDKKRRIIESDPNISGFIKEYIKYNYPQLYENYNFLSNIYMDCFELIQPFDYDEVKIFRSLAYLDNFESEFTIKEIYQEDSNNVINFINKNKDLFIENNKLLNLKPDLKTKLDSLNKIIDGENYPVKMESIKAIRNNLISNIIEEKREKTNLISSLETDIKIIEDCISSDKASFENTQKNFIEKENELIELRKQLNVFTTNRYFINSGLNFIFAIMIGVLSFFFPDIFSSPENHDSLFMVQLILYFVVIVFCVMSLYNLYQGLKLASKNKQKFEINSKLINAEQERANLQEHMTRLKENQELNKNLLSDKKEQLKLLRERLFILDKFIKLDRSND